ncbi:putative DNA-binding pseudobarrel domain superfamily [Helianthus debilis subsp. tardiflorus]
MITSLKIPSKSWVVFRYEEALGCFRIFYFYQDIALAPFDYFYYKSGCFKDRQDCMHVNKFFVHLVLNIVPAYPVVIRSCTNHKWFVRMEEIDCELYITTCWNRMKQEMSITNKHLVVFKMLDIREFLVGILPFYVILLNSVLLSNKNQIMI